MGRAKGALLLDLGVIADRLRAEPMLPRLSQAQKVVGLFEEAESELAKAVGMNPRQVVSVLGSLGPLLPAVALASYGARLDEVQRRFEEKLLEASRRAEGDEAKLEAVLKLAEAAEKAQAPWPSELRRSFQERLRARQALLSIEKELSKESGAENSHLL